MKIVSRSKLANKFSVALTLFLHDDPCDSRRSIGGKLLLSQPPASKALNSQLCCAIARRVVAKNTTKDKHIELVTILRCEITLSSGVEKADTLLGDVGR